MSLPCIIATTVTNDTSRPTYDWTKIPGLREFEVDAGDHWLFDKNDSRNLAGGLASTNLTPVGAAPTHGGNSITTADGMNGLRSVFPDSATMTVAGVFRRSAIATVGYGRKLISSTSEVPADGGSEILDLTSQVAMRSRQAGSTTMTGSTLIADGSWTFVAMSCNNANDLQTFFIGGLAPQSAVTDKTVAARTIGLGNIATNGSNYAYGCQAAELIVWPDKALTLADIQAVYARSKIRMSRRGHSVY